MAELKPCPFCGGAIRLVQAHSQIECNHVEYECSVCGMRFSYDQHFAYSISARIALNESFAEIWNRRAGDTDGRKAQRSEGVSSTGKDV